LLFVPLRELIFLLGILIGILNRLTLKITNRKMLIRSIIFSMAGGNLMSWIRNMAEY